MSQNPKGIPFILPPREVLTHVNNRAYNYAIYNYYGKGLITWAKKMRFIRALRLGSLYPSPTVIDMGTADGILLPTLSSHYSRVVAIDTNQEYLSQARGLCAALNLSNVEIFCNSEISIEELGKKTNPDCNLMYLLETLEHVGRQPNVWESKIRFLNECFQLLREGGNIVITVPKMIGPVMFIKNLLQRSLGLGYDEMTWKQLARSSFLNDTSELEPLWNGHHVGFNHLKLEEYMKKEFCIVHREESLISVFYVLSKRS